MLPLRFLILVFSTGLMGLVAGAVPAQDYPNKPIRIETGGAGGGADFTARLVAQGISGPLGQPLVIDNRGGGAIIFGDIVAKSPPDGYTLYVGGAALWLTPLLNKVPYDIANDFAPITLIERELNLVAVHPSLPVKSIKELIALAKGKPGVLNYASTGVASNAYFSMELFKSLAKVNIVEIPYKAPAQAITDLLSGQVQMTIIDSGLIVPHMKAGKLRALAVSSATPSALFPDLPTVAASGLPGYEWVGTTSMLAPGKTPRAIITRLNEETLRFLNRPGVKEQFLQGGVEVVGGSPEQLAATIKSNMADIGKVIKDAGIKVQ